MIEDTEVRGIVKRENKEYDLRVSFAPFTMAMGDRAALTSGAKAALSKVRGLPCTTADEYQRIGQFLVSCKGQTKAFEEGRKKLTAPLLAAKREIDGWFKPLKEIYTECEKILKAKIVDYQAQHIEQQRETQSQIKEAHDAGDYGAVMTHSQALGAVPVVDGVQTRMVWRFEVTDLEQVPRALLKLDEQRVRQAMKAGHKELPGLRIWQEPTIAAKAGK